MAPRETGKRWHLSEEAADYLARVATDGTLKTVFSELSENEPDLAG
jgi:hypothetical protein